MCFLPFLNPKEYWGVEHPSVSSLLITGREVQECLVGPVSMYILFSCTMYDISVSIHYLIIRLKFKKRFLKINKSLKIEAKYIMYNKKIDDIFPVGCFIYNIYCL